LMCGGKLFRVTNPIPFEDLDVQNSESLPLQHPPAIIGMSQRFSVLCTPLSSQSGSTIDLIYAQTMPLIRRAESLLKNEATHDQLHQLKLEAEQVKEALNAWPETVPQEWRPRSVGAISYSDDDIM